MTDKERQAIADLVFCIVNVDRIAQRKFPDDETVEKAKDFVQRYNKKKFELDGMLKLIKDEEESNE